MSANASAPNCPHSAAALEYWCGVMWCDVFTCDACYAGHVFEAHVFNAPALFRVPPNYYLPHEEAVIARGRLAERMCCGPTSKTRAPGTGT